MSGAASGSSASPSGPATQDPAKESSK
jgi:hypothetical protein